MEWKLSNNLRKFHIYYRNRQKLRYFKRWKNAWHQYKIWNLESRIDCLENQLNRNEMYNELYIGQNKDLLNQLKQYKEALAVCVDIVNNNENCDKCDSIWHKQFHQHLKSTKLRHTYIKDLL